MRFQAKKKKFQGFWGIVFLLVIFAGGFGWGKNIFELTDCDFDAPYKAEVIRVVSIPVWPMGMIVGYMDLGK